MKSGWFVAPVYSGTDRAYEVYRMIDAEKDNTDSNREIYSTLPSREEAVRLAKELNAAEAERFWTRQSS